MRANSRLVTTHVQRSGDTHFFLVGAAVCFDSVSVGGRGNCEGMGECYRRGKEGRGGERGVVRIYTHTHCELTESTYKDVGYRVPLSFHCKHHMSNLKRCPVSSLGPPPAYFGRGGGRGGDW